jgi:hypothetical protein
MVEDLVMKLEFLLLAYCIKELIFKSYHCKASRHKKQCPRIDDLTVEEASRIR